MGRLEAKVALVTGAARGMGEAIARRFAAEGARVVLADVLDAPGRAAAARIGEAALFVRLDVTDEGEWERAVAAAEASFGRLDVLVNNAGVVRSAPLLETSLEDYRRVVEVNQTGVFLGMRVAGGTMAKAGGGSIVNVSSIDGLVAMERVIGYVASKFAVRGMTKAAALELARHGIRVNSIHPGYIETPMLDARPGQLDRLRRFCAERVPAGRTGRAEEIASLAVFLASDESSYCTGAEFLADGGLLAGHQPPGA